MQQMAGHMNLLSPFVFNQFGPYNAYAQTQQQAALMAAAQGTYMNPMAALATQIPHALGGKFKIIIKCVCVCVSERLHKIIYLERHIFVCLNEKYLKH